MGCKCSKRKRRVDLSSSVTPNDDTISLQASSIALSVGPVVVQAESTAQHISRCELVPLHSVAQLVWNNGLHGSETAVHSGLATSSSLPSDLDSPYAFTAQRRKPEIVTERPLPQLDVVSYVGPPGHRKPVYEPYPSLLIEAQCDTQFFPERAYLVSGLFKMYGRYELGVSEEQDENEKLRTLRLQEAAFNKGAELLQIEGTGLPVESARSPWPAIREAELQDSETAGVQNGTESHTALTDYDRCTQGFEQLQYLLSKLGSQSPVVDPVKVIPCDSRGVKFTDECHGISLHIPEGAISPSRGTVWVEVGVTMHSLFKIPDGLRVVSPIVWICINEGTCVTDGSITLTGAMEVTLPHCVDVIDSFDCLQFLKANHEVSPEGNLAFVPVQDQTYFQNRFCGTLHTTHCCFQCIALKYTPEITRNICYRLIKIEPIQFFPLDDSSLIYCVTYCLPTCIQTVMDQYAKGFRRKLLHRFKFSEAKLGIVFERNKLGWMLSLDSPGEVCISIADFHPKHIGIQIFAEDVDFWSVKDDYLQKMEELGDYPPRFIIRADGSKASDNCILEVHFKGAENVTAETMLRVPTKIHPDQEQKRLSAAPLSSTCIAAMRQKPKLQHLQCFRWHDGQNIRKIRIMRHISQRWKDFAIALNLEISEITNIETGYLRDPVDCTHHLISKWYEKANCNWEQFLKALEDADFSGLAATLMEAQPWDQPD